MNQSKLNQLISNVETAINAHKSFLHFLDVTEVKQDSFQYGETFGKLSALETVLKDLKSIKEER